MSDVLHSCSDDLNHLQTIVNLELSYSAVGSNKKSSMQHEEDRWYKHDDFNHKNERYLLCADFLR